jgi:hypothetical protein
VRDALHVECFVNVFEEGEADDAVVCAFVEGEGGGTESGRLRVGGVDAGGVEDLIYNTSC